MDYFFEAQRQVVLYCYLCWHYTKLFASLFACFIILFQVTVPQHVTLVVVMISGS